MIIYAVFDTNILVSAMISKRSDTAVVLALDTLLNDEVIPLYNDEIIKEYNDVVFYEVALSQEDSFLVTGNTKHFPKTPIVVTPLEFLKIIGKI